MYLIDIPPPTISGKLHMGHLFSYSQMDFVARYERDVRGHQLLYPYCYDNTGVPTEKLALENRVTDPMDIIGFSDRVSKDYEALFRDMGYAMDYTHNPYSTFSPMAIEVANMAFRDLLRKGLVYEDERDSLWCPKTKVWVSQSEVDEAGCYERSGAKVEVRKQAGWFVKVVDNLGRIRAAVNEIDWRPEHYKNRLLSWLDGYKYDWSISRDRRFGVPLPYDIVPDDQVVFDTWFISSLTPQIAYSTWTSSPTLFTPVFDARFQAHDIINTWALYTIIQSVLHNDQIPWKRIVVSGHALTGEGGKMSKSKGKNVPPKDLIAKYGADAIRYWAGQSQPGTDAKIDYEAMEKGRKLVNKIKNARKFLVFNRTRNLEGNGFNSAFYDQWIKSREFIAREMAVCNWANALHELTGFFWGTYCDKMIEEAKTAHYGETMRDILEEVLVHFSVFMPNIKELTN